MTTSPVAHRQEFSNNEPQLINVDEFAGLLGISTRTLWRLRSAGKLPLPIQLGGSVRWKLAEVKAGGDAGCPD